MGFLTHYAYLSTTNCTYPESKLYLINSDCTHRGICQGDGTCLCDEGFTGYSDWINAGNLDCHLDMRFLFTLCYCTLGTTSLSIITSFRLFRKTWKGMRENERNMKTFLRKRQVQVCLHNVNVMVSFFLTALHKVVYSDRNGHNVLTVDPSNPVFFAYYFLAGNSVWWTVTLFLRSIIDPILKGIHKKEDRETIRLLALANRWLNSVCVLDLLLYIISIVPSLWVGGVIVGDPNGKSILISYLLVQSLLAFEYLVIGLMCCYILHLTIKVSTKCKNKQSPNSTATALSKFRTRVYRLLPLVVGGCIYGFVSQAWYVFHDHKGFKYNIQKASVAYIVYAFCTFIIVEVIYLSGNKESNRQSQARKSVGRFTTTNKGGGASTKEKTTKNVEFSQNPISERRETFVF